MVTSVGVWMKVSLLFGALAKATNLSGEQSLQITVAPSGPMAIPGTKNLQRGRVMKTTRSFIFRYSLRVFAILFLLSGSRIYAQSKSAARITQAVDETKLVQLQTRVHPLARPEFDRGVVADSQPMNRMMLVLKRSPEQQAALSELMNEQQTKNSPNYHAWLTPAQFGQQFGVGDADIQQVTGWLTQKGFTGIKVAPGKMFIEFSGTAGKVRSAFHTEMHQFMVKGEMHMANTSVPQIPAALSPVVASIHSLHNFRKKSYMHFVKPELIASAKKGAGSNFTFANVCGANGTQPCTAVGPGDFAKIYNLPAGLDGTGQTIALVARSNVATSDITQFGQAFGIANLTNFSQANNVVLTGPDPGLMPGDQDEATLDVEWSGAVAPGAKILLVPSDIQASNFIDGVDLSAFFIVQNNLAQIMSQSFGQCEFFANDALEDSLWEQAAAQGITVMVAAGDNGSAGCDPDVFANVSTDGLQISGSASTPFNVAVGGTDFDDAANPSTFWNTTNSGTGLASAKSYIPEITWNGTCASTATSATLSTACASIDPNDLSQADLSGGSGGASTCGTVNASNICQPYPKPAWQQLAGLTGMPADNARDVPDVSLFAAVNTASNHFYIICEASSPLQNGNPCSLSGTLNFSGVGGTSASSPAFAGILALVNQNEVSKGRLKALVGQGNVNYVLYPLAVTQYGNAALNCNSSTGPAAGCTFNDVTKGNNSVACVGAGFGTNSLGLTTNPNCSSTTTAIGVLVEPTATTTPGWTTTAGYDLATGLGSVNVSNLVANWGNVTGNYKTSTTTVTTVPASLTTPALAHGANATFNVTVASGSGTPTGDVSLIIPSADPFASNSTGVNAATLTGGTTQVLTNQLPGGTYNVTVHYTGDGTFAPSDSGPVSVTVNKENSTAATSLWEYWTNAAAVLSPASAPYGSLYLFRVDVIGSNASDNQQCIAAATSIPCPTGNVTFTADGNPLNDFINSKTGTATNVAALNPLGFIEDRVLGSTGLPAGNHSIVANYAGDVSYNPIAAPALAITITQTPAQTAVSATAGGKAATTVAVGQSVNLIATVGTESPITGGPSSGAGPTGSVTFSSCGSAASCIVNPITPIAASNITGGAIATGTLATTFATSGVQTIMATYSGDTNYNSCATVNTTPPANCTITPFSFVVASKLGFTVQPTNVAANASIAPAVQVAVQDGSGNTITGASSPVTIAIGTNAGGGTLAGTLTANAVNGVATFSNLSINSAGTGYTLVASTPNLPNATSAAFNVGTVGSFTISYPAQPTVLNSTTGAAVGTTITVTPSGGFTGNVVVTATAATLPAGVTCPNSPITINVPTALTGTLNCQVIASSSGLSAANITAMPFYEAKATPLKSPASGKNTGKGWLALSAGTGFAALFLFFLPGGRKRLHAALGLGLVCILSFTLGCNGGYGGGGGGGPVATTTAMTVNADKEPSGTAFTFNATVTGGTPAGMAQLYDGATAISTAGASAAVSGGKASLTWNPGAAASGTHMISVHYLGDTYTKASQSGSLNLTVTGGTTIAITTNPTATPAASPITVTVQ